MKIATAIQTVYKGPAHILISTNEENKLHKLSSGQINLSELETVTKSKVVLFQREGTLLERNNIVSLDPPSGAHIMPALTKGYIVESGEIQEVENKIIPNEQEYLVVADDENNPSKVFILKHSGGKELKFEIIEALEEKELFPSKEEGSNGASSTSKEKPLKIIFGFKVDQHSLETDWIVDVKKELARSSLKERQKQYFHERDEELARIDLLANKPLVTYSPMVKSEPEQPKKRPSIIDHSVGIIGEPTNGHGRDESWRELLTILGIQKGTLPALLQRANKIDIPQNAKPKVREWIDRNRETELAMKLANNVNLIYS